MESLSEDAKSVTSRYKNPGLCSRSPGGSDEQQEERDTERRLGTHLCGELTMLSLPTCHGKKVHHIPYRASIKKSVNFGYPETKAAPFQIQQNTGNQPRRETDWEADRRGRAGERRGKSLKQQIEPPPIAGEIAGYGLGGLGNKKNCDLKRRKGRLFTWRRNQVINRSNRIESRSSDAGRGRN